MEGVTRKERIERGRSLRKKVPRSSHAKWVPPSERPEAVELLEASGANRLRRLLPIRYRRMSTSPFAFYRGAAMLMALDLGSTPVSGLTAQLGGDAHVSNFGAFGTPERDLVFDINDFDETLPGPWEWDVKRLGASLVLAGRLNGLPARDNRRAVRRAVRAYRESMAAYARMTFLDAWYAHLDRRGIARVVRREGRREVGELFAHARRRTELHAFLKMVRRQGGRYRIRDSAPLIVHYSTRTTIEQSVELYHRYLSTLAPERRTLLEHYRVVDVAEKVVGVGSVGTRCSVMLLLGDPDVEDPVFLQVKEALPSVLEAALGPSPFSNHAQRVVVGQRLMQEASDVFLGWSTFRGKDFYLRQLRDMKFSPEVTGLGKRGLGGRGELCGASLARAHARTGDVAAISGYLGDTPVFDEAIALFAERYADQTEADYAELLRAIQTGRLPAAEA